MSADKKSIRIAVLGAGGRMGKSIIRYLAEEAVPGLTLSAAVDLWDAPDLNRDAGSASGTEALGVPITSDLAAAAKDADVVVDFTSHHGTAGNAPRCAEWGHAMVIGTTGLNEEETDAVRAAAEKIPVVMAANMSLGVNLLANLVRDAAASLADRGYDIEIVERHHRRKKDAPSGTALLLGRAAAEGAGRDFDDVVECGRSGHTDGDRPAERIGIQAVRGGDIVGDHTVIFAGEGEVIELSHRATRRDVFALGALRAAAWIHGKPAGLYGMNDVLGL